MEWRCEPHSWSYETGIQYPFITRLRITDTPLLIQPSCARSAQPVQLGTPCTMRAYSRRWTRFASALCSCPSASTSPCSQVQNCERDEMHSHRTVHGYCDEISCEELYFSSLRCCCSPSHREIGAPYLLLKLSRKGEMGVPEYIRRPYEVAFENRLALPAFNPHHLLLVLPGRQQPAL